MIYREKREKAKPRSEKGHYGRTDGRKSESESEERRVGWDDVG